jgi:CRP-like cAMP-binding protein
MDYLFLSKTLLFRGIAPEAIPETLSCLGADVRRYKKGSCIFHSGDIVHSIGLVLSGQIQIEYDDLWGNRSILYSIQPGQVFAEAYACLPGQTMMVDAVAVSNAEVLLLNVEQLLRFSQNACSYHNQLIHNLLSISAHKNLNLSRRVFFTASKNIRGRLQSYFSEQAARSGKTDFSIPFNRQQLADYLNVDRSALSTELGKMRREGLLDFQKNHFRILQSSWMQNGSATHSSAR